MLLALAERVALTHATSQPQGDTGTCLLQKAILKVKQNSQSGDLRNDEEDYDTIKENFEDENGFHVKETENEDDEEGDEEEEIDEGGEEGDGDEEEEDNDSEDGPPESIGDEDEKEEEEME